MWNIIKAEIRYYWKIYLALYGFVAVFLVINILVGELEDELLWIVFITLPMIGNFVTNEERKTRRIRLYARLPISMRKIAVARYPFLLTYWFSMVLLIYLSSYLSRPFGSIALSPWEILSFATTGPLLAAGMTLHLDLKFCSLNPIKKALFRYFLALLAIVIIFFYLAAYLTNATGTFDLPPFLILRLPSIAIVFCGLAAGFLISSVIVFEHRKSYLE